MLAKDSKFYCYSNHRASHYRRFLKYISSKCNGFLCDGSYIEIMNAQSRDFADFYCFFVGLLFFFFSFLFSSAKSYICISCKLMIKVYQIVALPCQDYNWLLPFFFYCFQLFGEVLREGEGLFYACRNVNLC